MRIKNILIVLIIFFLIISPPAYAEIELSMELRDGNKNLINTENIVSPTSDLVLYITINNPTTDWIVLTDFRLRLQCLIDNEVFQCSEYPQLISGKIQPEDSEVFPIILDGYNGRNENSKIGNLIIKFSGYTYLNTQCFTTTLDEMTTCRHEVKIINSLDFKVQDIETTNGSGLGSKINLDLIYKIVGIVAGILFILAFFSKKKR